MVSYQPPNAAAVGQQRPLVGREYLRVSRDRSGRQRSVTEQHEDNAQAAAISGIELGDPYREEGAVSASRYGKRVRGGFDQLLSDLEGGSFGADVLVLWESSRGSRKVGEWVRLIEASEARGLMIHVTTHARTYDPANPRDRRSLLEDAVDSEYESGKTSMRIRRNMASMAAQGRPHGVPPFGYRRRYDPDTREVSWIIDATEARLVREIMTRIETGEPLSAISRDFARRGLRTRRDARWYVTSVRKLALNPAIAGYRSHYGELTPANWEAIVPQRQWNAVKMTLTAPGRTTTRPARAVHLLSHVARCDSCGGVLAVRGGERKRRYRCRDQGCVTIVADPLDAYVERVVVGYLSRPDVAEMLAADAGSSPEVEQLDTELSAVQGRLTELYAEVRSGALSPRALAAIEPSLLADADRLQRRRTELAAPGVADLIDPASDVRASWKQLDVARQRQVVRLVATPTVLGTIYVRRRIRGDALDNRVRWQRHQSDAGSEPAEEGVSEPTDTREADVSTDAA